MYQLLYANQDDEILASELSGGKITVCSGGEWDMDAIVQIWLPGWRLWNKWPHYSADGYQDICMMQDEGVILTHQQEGDICLVLHGNSRFLEVDDLVLVSAVKEECIGLMAGISVIRFSIYKADIRQYCSLGINSFQNRIDKLPI